MSAKNGRAATRFFVVDADVLIKCYSEQDTLCGARAAAEAIEAKTSVKVAIVSLREVREVTRITKTESKVVEL